MSECLSIFACPVCGDQLFDCTKSLKCENGHSFDVAAEGYVNLDVSGRVRSGDSGDMIRARHDFLKTGYYASLRLSLGSHVVELLSESVHENNLYVDAGCGEGYYTAGIYDELKANGISSRAAGFDISKPAVKTAAKQRGRDIAFAVASVYKLPLTDCCADIVLTVFAPVCADEFNRVLRPGGSLVIVAPGKRHLFGLKEVLYDSPYENDENVFELDGFVSAGMYRVNDEITVTGKDDINNLFMMTPYYWKTPSEGAKRLGTLEKLTTPTEFELHILRKI